MEKIIIKTPSIYVREQHSKYKVLFHNSINIRRQCKIVCAFLYVITDIFRLGEKAVEDMVRVVPS